MTIIKFPQPLLYACDDEDGPGRLGIKPPVIIGVLQARSSSSRLPGKILKPILGQPMLARQIERLQRSTRLDRLVIATSTDKSDDAVEALCSALEIDCYRGSLDDVLDRIYQSLRQYQPDHFVRLTGDCPLVDPTVIDDLITFHLDGVYDYSSNTITPTWPDGLDAEICKFEVIEMAWNEASVGSDREHVTPFIYNNPERFCLGDFRNETNLSRFRWTVDEPADFRFVEKVYSMLYSHNPEFTTTDILELLKRRPELEKINKGFIRNEGYEKSLVHDVAGFNLTLGQVDEKGV